MLLALTVRPSALPASPVPETGTEIVYLSGRGKDDAVPWEFRCRVGRKCGAWTTIPVPSNWELQGFGSYAYGLEENPVEDVGEYRLELDVPDRWRDRRTWLVFAGVMTDAEVRLNGELLGHHRGAFYPFRFEVTEALRYPGPNRLEVIVHEESANGSVNRAERRADYWVFGGIFRPVWLESRPRESIASVALDGRADGGLSASVELTGIRTGDRVVGRVETPGGETVGAPFGSPIPSGGREIELATRIPGIEPWSAESPRLYRVRLRLLAGDRELHEITERIGFRTVELVPSRGLFVNGRKVLLKGVNRHSFWPDSGRTTSPAISREDVRLLRRMNVNAVRTSHYPPDEHFLDACDEAGLYVMDELAGWHDAYDATAGRPLVRAMVERDRNHPSVVLWANGNEGGWNHRLDREFTRFDPQNRPVLHPDATFSGVDAEHYPDWEELRGRLGLRRPSATKPATERSSEIVLPTEILHGLYDGGGAAGLERFWTAIRTSPRGGGLFLWALLDEGIVRNDRGGALDTDGNHAPDGVLGPYRQPEASFRGLREIFSPVELRIPDPLPRDFDGRIEVVNRFDHRTLRGRFVLSWRSSGVEGWRLESIAEGVLPAPALAPGERGIVSIPVDPSGEALRITYVDARGEERMTWAVAASRGSRTDRILRDRTSGRTGRQVESWTLAGGGTRALFEASGELADLRLQGVAVPLRGGLPLAGTPETVSSTGDGRLEIRSDDPNTGFSLYWSVGVSGALRLEYRLSPSRASPSSGIGFQFPFEAVRRVRWEGQGPHRVWENRLAGTRFGRWSRRPNRTVTGQTWDYPELPGYYRGVRRLELVTVEAGLRLDIAGTPFVQLFTPPAWDDPGGASAPFPAADLSLLHRIPAIGTKFHSPEALGHESKPSPPGALEGTLVLRLPDPSRTER